VEKRDFATLNHLRNKPDFENKIHESHTNSKSKRCREFQRNPTNIEKNRNRAKRRNRRRIAKISEIDETWRDALKHECKVFQIINTSIPSVKH
jgi:hypothetical protein